jgi:hypothetical protein
MKRAHLLLAFALIGGHSSTFAASTEVEALLEKARARLGGDTALEAVRSVHFYGTIELSETPGAANTPMKSAVEIIFQKPTQHRLVVTSEKSIDTTALDGYFAWRRIEPAATGARPQTILLNKEQIKRLRANTWENLFFFRGIEGRGGELLDGGETERDGVKCRKLSFRYGPGIDFVRYFEVATGRLVLTETQPVGIVREEGDLLAGGVRFPKKLVTTVPAGPDGGARVITLVFDRIALNETFPASVFEEPLFSARR